jgi:hypothetical protein
MTAVLPRPTRLRIPMPRMPSEPMTRSTPAVAYQSVLHQTVRREFRMLAGLAGWAPADDTVRTAWRVVGHRNFRTAVVRLRGAPPAA